MFMPTTVVRPQMSNAPGDGVMRCEYFQVAYVTNDLERAAAVFSERYGIKAYTGLDGQHPDGGSITIKLAWAGGVMIELIEAKGPGTDFYTSRLPADGFAIRHHPLAYLVNNLADWNALMDELARKDMPIVFSGHTEGYMRFCYAYAAEVDHYLEYFLLEADGIAFFESVPAS